MRLVFHGVRGSVPVGSPETERYGGATTCLGAELDSGAYLILDCGTGMRRFEAQMNPGARRFTVLLSHYHWDHLMGLPFFSPLFDEDAVFDFYGSPWEGHSVEEGVAGTFRPPWFPLRLSDTAAAKKFQSVPEGPWAVDNVTITAARLNHPQGVTAYRLDSDAGSVVFATDVERGDPVSDAALTELASGADVLIHDAQYSLDDISSHRGWGHSTWEDGVAAAEDAGVDKLVLVSHDPVRTDDQVDELVEKAQRRFPNTVAAYAGMELEF